jgi:hypothetical protein
MSSIDQAREAERAADIGLEARRMIQTHGEDWAAIGRAMIRKVESALAEDRVCKDGHRYHVLKPREPLLYCRRCGTVVNADG